MPAPRRRTRDGQVRHEFGLWTDSVGYRDSYSVLRSRSEGAAAGVGTRFVPASVTIATISTGASAPASFSFVSPLSVIVENRERIAMVWEPNKKFTDGKSGITRTGSCKGAQ